MTLFIVARDVRIYLNLQYGNTMEKSIEFLNGLKL